MTPGSLGQQLKRLRKIAGVTQAELAVRLGWAASDDWRESANARAKISKIENGHQLPSANEVRLWCAAVGREDAAGELVLMQADAAAEYRSSYGQMRRGAAPSQAEFDTLVRDAILIRNCAPNVVPAFLQTAGYARGIFEQVAGLWGARDIEAAVQARLRRQEALYSPGKTFGFLVTEAALGLQPCPAEAMLGQLAFLERFLDLGLGNVSLGIIPLGVRLPVMPTTDFLLLDGRAIVETSAGEVQAGELDSAKYTEIFDLLAAVARTGDGARQLITSAAARLRDGESE